MNLINGSLKFLASASYAIIYIYANELFPTNVRNTGMGICSMVARIGAIIGTFCNDSLVNKNFHSLFFLSKWQIRISDSYLDTFACSPLWYCISHSSYISSNVSWNIKQAIASISRRSWTNDDDWVNTSNNDVYFFELRFFSSFSSVLETENLKVQSRMEQDPRVNR